MSYKYISSRQINNADALSNIGSAAGARLDTILADINNALASVTAAAGYIAQKAALTSGSTSIAITIPSQADTSFVVLGMMGNVTDPNPQFQQVEVTAKATTGFTFSWDNPLDTNNYFLYYVVFPKYIQAFETAISSDSSNVSLALPNNYDGIPILVGLQNIVDAHPQFQPVVIGSSTSSSTPTVTVLTSGSGTYTTPANVAYIEVEMIGGGGGGGGANISGGGGAGGTTTFGSDLLISPGGNGGLENTSGLNALTFPTINSPAIPIVGLAGAQGQGSGAASYNNMYGGMGASTTFGGGGAGAPGFDNQNAGSAISNTGAGGGGASWNGGSNGSGGGGNAGAYIKAFIVNPTSAYSYTVGGGGGGGGTGGGNGGSGLIIITEHYLSGSNATSINLELNTPTDSANYKMVSVINSTGQETISNSATSVTVNLPVGYGSSNYAILASVQNTLDSSPQFQPMILTTQTNQTATFSWNSPTVSANYLINFFAISLTS